MSTAIKRQSTGDGRWFNLATAQKFCDSFDDEGRTEHEDLYRTAGGHWVLNHWSQYEGSPEFWLWQTDDEASKWLVRHDHYPDSPATIRDLIAAREIV